MMVMTMTMMMLMTMVAGTTATSCTRATWRTRARSSCTRGDHRLIQLQLSGEGTRSLRDTSSLQVELHTADGDVSYEYEVGVPAAR